MGGDGQRPAQSRRDCLQYGGRRVLRGEPGALEQRVFLEVPPAGHPAGNKWYDQAPNMGPRPADPTGGQAGRRHLDAQRIPQYVPPAVTFPYKKMGQSVTAVMLDASGGAFGPFAGQFFVADYSLAIVMRAEMEKVNGVYQGAS